MMRSMALPAVRPLALVPVGQVVRLPVARAMRRLEVAAEAVAALARNHVEAHAAGRRLGADAAVW